VVNGQTVLATAEAGGSVTLAFEDRNKSGNELRRACREHLDSVMNGSAEH
jgi:hypothetical protein